MRYVFQLEGASGQSDVDLPDLSEARRQAVLTARDLLNDETETFRDGSRFELRVADETGAEVIRIRVEMTETRSSDGDLAPSRR